jgi:hypothetical protein
MYRMSCSADTRRTRRQTRVQRTSAELLERRLKASKFCTVHAAQNRLAVIPAHVELTVKAVPHCSHAANCRPRTIGENLHLAIGAAEQHEAPAGDECETWNAARLADDKFQRLLVLFHLDTPASDDLRDARGTRSRLYEHAERTLRFWRLWLLPVEAITAEAAFARRCEDLFRAIGTNLRRPVRVLDHAASIGPSCVRGLYTPRGLRL